MTLITPDFGILFWQSLTFLTVLLVLSKFAWKPILSILKERENTIAYAIDQVAQAQALMDQVTYDRTKLLQEANLKYEHIIEEALETQRKIVSQAHQEALEMKEHLLVQARIEMAKEEERALETLKSNMGVLAVQIAEKLLIKELSQDQAQLELIERLTTGESQSS